MALLPSIALPPCLLGRRSTTKVRDPLAVGRVRTSRLVYDPSSYLSLRHPLVQLQPPFQSLAGTPLPSFVSWPRLRTPWLLRAARGPLYAAAYLGCFISYVSGNGYCLLVCCLRAFCSLRRWFPVCFLVVLGQFFPSLYLRACSCGECSCGLLGGLFLSLGEMCGWSHTRGTWGGGQPWGGEDHRGFLTS